MISREHTMMGSASWRQARDEADDGKRELATGARCKQVAVLDGLCSHEAWCEREPNRAALKRCNLKCRGAGLPRDDWQQDAAVNDAV